MQVTQEQVNPCEVDLRIEVEVEKVQSAMDESYKELAKTTKIPGFRPGKAPKEMLERYVGEDRVKELAVDKIMQPAYSEALEETKIEPWAPADVELVEFELGSPFVFKARIPLAPKVELGEYVGLEVERKVEPVTDEMIDGEITEMRERHAKFNPVTDREVQTGDTAVIELSDEAEPEKEPARQVVLVGDNVPDFDAGVMGMKLEEEKVIPVTYPEDHKAEEMRGKSASLKVKLIELFHRELPELNDEWVKATFASPKEGEDEPDADAVDTVEKLKSTIRDAMERVAQNSADAQVRDAIIDKVIEGSEICFPERMVNERVEERLHDLAEELKKRKLNVEDYLKHVGKNPEELREEFAEEAKEALKANLAVYEVVEKESIKVEDEDIDAEIKLMAESRKIPAESMRAYVESAGGMSQIRYQLLRKKALDFLVHASNIKNVG